jgi:hypothetical protein
MVLANSFGQGLPSKEISFAMRVPLFAVHSTAQLLTSRGIRKKMFHRN